MSYKIIYHEGSNVDLGTKACSGRLSIESNHLRIRGEVELSFPLDSLVSVELIRLHHTGRMIKIVHTHGLLFVSVVWFNLFGVFAMVNFFATGRLLRELQDRIAKPGKA